MSNLTICLTIFAACMLLFAWNRFPMSVVSLATLLALVVTKCLKPQEALSGFGDTNNMIIITMFIVAAGLNRTTFTEKLSRFIVKWSRGSLKYAFLGYLIMAFFLTNFIFSPLAVFAIVFPMSLSLSETFHLEPSKTAYPLVVVAIVCCCALPLSIAITNSGIYNGYLAEYGLSQYRMVPLDFMFARLPLAIVTLLWAYFYGFKHAPDRPVVPIEYHMAKTKEKKPLSPFGELMGVVIFFGVIFLLITQQFHGIPTWVVTFGGACLTVFCGVLTEKEAIAAIPVSASTIYVGCLAMAKALTVTGAGDIVGATVSQFLAGSHNGYLLGGIFFLVPFLLTQLMLNKAVIGIFIPIAILTCKAVGANPIGPILLVYSGALAAILAPMATPALPLAMSVGGYDQKALLKQGWLLSILLSVGYVFWVMTIYPAF